MPVPQPPPDGQVPPFPNDTYITLFESQYPLYRAGLRHTSALTLPEQILDIFAAVLL